MPKINISGHEYGYHKIDTPNSAILVIKGSKGILACGYINIAASNKFNDAVAIVSGVKNSKDMINAEIKNVSKKASELGIRIGMKGLEALKILH